MHSKVIVASLVCMLAASFNVTKGIVPNFIKTAKQAETMVDHAPNDDRTFFDALSDDDCAGSQISADFNHEEPLSYLGVYQCSAGVTGSVDLSSDGVWASVRVNVPQAAGDYFVTFGYRFIGSSVLKKKTIYVHSDGINQCVSALSADDARGKFFYYHVATSEERDFLSYREEFNFNYNSDSPSSRIAPKMAKTANGIDDYAGAAIDLVNHRKDEKIPSYIAEKFIEKPWIIADPITPTYELTRFDAEKHYVDYVFGNSGDVVISNPVFTRGSSRLNDVNVTVNASWVDENNVEHPLRGIKVDLLAPDNSSMDVGNGAVQDAHFTNDAGVYTTTLPYAAVHNYSRSELQLRLSTVSRATYIENGNYLNYPICYSRKDSTSFLSMQYLAEYSNVEFTIKIYPGLSDRSNAYEICQAQALPYEYANAFSDGIDTVRTEYPYNYSAYFNYRNYYHIVRIQQEDYKSWDLLNHEYSHYICDVLNLCEIPSNGIESIHDVYEDLIDKFGYYDGPAIAYREGLATYLGIASQLYYKSNNPSVNIPGVGDEIYQDTYRNVNVNYNAHSPAGSINGYWPSPVRGEAIESNVTSFMLKALDNVQGRWGDNIALGHQKMWDALFNDDSYSISFDSVCDFVGTLARQNPSVSQSIKMLAWFESIAEEIIVPKEIAKWTIMIYMDGCNLESGDKDDNNNWVDAYPPGAASDDISEILSVNSKSDEVNIIIETGGAERWKNPNIEANKICRFEVGYYHSLNRVDTLNDADMGDEATFESFLKWGLTEYPAEKTGVILWNHGSYLGGACGLTIDMISEACNNSFSYAGVSKLDFIGYDACNCQSQDGAEFNSQYFDYMVASQAGVPSEGWVYNKWIDDVYRLRNTEEVVTEIVDTYVDEYEGGHTLSVLKLSYMAEYKNNFEAFASELKNAFPLTGTSMPAPLFSIRKFAEFSYSFGFNGTNSATVDGLDFMKIVRIAAEFNGSMSIATIDAAIISYNQVVFYNRTGEDAENFANGMSIFVAGGTNTLYFGDDIAVALGLIDDPWYPEEQTHFTVWRSIFFQN